MPTRVLWWPPVYLTAWELTLVKPTSRSVGLIDGRPRASAWARPRHMVTARVHGSTRDRAGSGYIEMLKEVLAPGELIRMRAQSAIWHVARASFASTILQWTDGAQMLWTDGSASLLWDTGGFAGTATTLDGLPAVRVTGLPAQSIVVRPHEVVARLDGAGGKDTSRRALRVVRSDSAGVAVIPFLGEPWGADASASIGEAVEMTLEPLDLWTATRAEQPAFDAWQYQVSLREVFADEYDGWTLADPFGSAP